MDCTVITHGDTDGIVSAALVSRKWKEPAMYTTSPADLHRVLALSILHDSPSPLYILDLAPSDKTAAVASYYDKVTWIDHHDAEPRGRGFDNITFVQDPEAKSAASVVAHHLDIKGEPLVSIADQVDTNRPEGKEAEIIRAVVGYIRGHNRGKDRDTAFRELILDMGERGLDVLGDQRYLGYANLFMEKMHRTETELETKVEEREVGASRVAFVEGAEDIPVYVITDYLLRERGEFDFIIVKRYKQRGDKLASKFEFRTHTGKNVLDIARMLRGGGHPRAAGAQVEGDMDLDSVISMVQLVSEQHENG